MPEELLLLLSFDLLSFFCDQDFSYSTFFLGSFLGRFPGKLTFFSDFFSLLFSRLYDLAFYFGAFP